jgi:hypothetical protein
VDTAITNEKIKQLRDSKTKELNFKKTLTGGYQSKEVDEFIHSLQANMEQSQRVFNEKLEEHSSKTSILSQERESLAKKCKALEAQMQQSQTEAVAKTQRLALLEQEVDRLNALLASMRQEQKTRDVSLAKENMDHLAKENKELSQSGSRLLIENRALKKTTEELYATLDELKASNQEKEEKINALISSKRNQAMDTNMKIYQYRLNFESNVKNAMQNMQEFMKTVELLKAESDTMYDKTRIDLDL